MSVGFSQFAFLARCISLILFLDRHTMTMAVLVVFVVTLIISAECQLASETFRKGEKQEINLTEISKLARDNVLRNGKAVRCAQPRPKVIKVQAVHPHASKRFVPSCVVLHRCGRDVGCCDDPLTTCAYSRKRRVLMYFYVVSLGSDGLGSAVTSEGKIEALSFVNHTQCTCRRRRKVQQIPHKQESTVSRGGNLNFVDFIWILYIFILNSILLLR